MLSLNQCLLLVAIPIVFLILLSLVIMWLGRPKTSNWKCRKVKQDNTNTLSPEQKEMYEIAFQMDCIWAGKNILHQFIRQVSDVIPRQEIINYLANSIKICNNNQEIKALNINPSAGTDVYLKHAEDFYRGLVEEYEERIKDKI